MASGKTRLGVSAYAISVFIFTLGGNAVRWITGVPIYFALAGIITVIGVVLFIKVKPARFRWYRLPAPLYWFMTIALLSIIWSQYRLESVLGVVAQLATTVVAIVLAYTLTWHEVLRTLATSLRYLIGLSFLFELWVSLFVGHYIVAWWVEVPEGETPSKLLWWSRNLLFEGGPIQGLLGNSALFCFLGVLGLVIFSVQLRAGLIGRFNGWFWIAMSVLTIAMTRAATVMVAIVVIAITLAFALWARRVQPGKRTPLYAIGSVLLFGSIAVSLFWREQVFGLLGKSATLTGRTEIWERVIELAEQRPWLGWGWVSYWPTWVEPFKSLDTKVGLPVPHAHNAWLDVWFQVGIIGLLAFIPLVALTLWRVWFRAVDQPRRGYGAPLPYATSALWPLLVLAALLVQSLTESRLIIEGGWVLLVLLAVKSRFDFQLPSPDSEPVKVPWRHVPITRDAATGTIPTISAAQAAAAKAATPPVVDPDSQVQS